MAEESGQERTEAPSPQRLEKAREDGQVLQSRELATFVVLMTGGTALCMMASGLGQTLSNIVRGGLQFNPGIARDDALVMAQLSNQFLEAALALAPFLALMVIATVSHLGFVVLGIFALNLQGLEGGILQMLNHGFSTGALFLIVGMIYERRHTRMIDEFGGLSKVMPVLATFFLIVTLSSVGLPGLNGFGENFSSSWARSGPIWLMLFLPPWGSFLRRSTCSGCFSASCLAR